MIFFLAALLAPTSVAADTLDPGLPLFCLDSTNKFEPFVNADYGALLTAMREQFRFKGTLNEATPTDGTLVFHGGEGGRETISYKLSTYDDGLALLSMHVRLKGVTEDLKGNDMCFRTMSLLQG